MARFWGNHPGTRQDRGFRKGKLATKEEVLASMLRELHRREEAYGSGHWLTERQRQAIARFQ